MCGQQKDSSQQCVCKPSIPPTQTAPVPAAEKVRGGRHTAVVVQCCRTAELLLLSHCPHGEGTNFTQC
jgi:hypothetical protein